MHDSKRVKLCGDHYRIKSEGYNIFGGKTCVKQWKHTGICESGEAKLVKYLTSNH